MLLLLWTLSALARDDVFAELPLHHTQVFIESVTEPMHWFDASSMDVEWSGCRVGVPVTQAPRADEVSLRCYYPAGQVPDVSPDQPALAAAWKLAKRAVGSDRGRSRLSVHYVGTWAEVRVGDVVPLPAADNPHVDRLYLTGTGLYAVRGREISAASPPGVFGWGGLGLAPQVDAPLYFLDVAIPPALDGTSVLAQHRTDPDDPTLAAAEAAIRAAMLAAVPAYAGGERPGPRLEFPAILPQQLARQLTLELSAFLRPALDGRGMPVTEQRSMQETFRAPLDLALDQPLRWHRAAPALGLGLVLTLDLPAGQAELELTGPGGQTGHAVWTVDIELERDGAAAFPARVTSTCTGSQPPPRYASHEPCTFTFDAGHPFASLDVFPRGWSASTEAWLGGGDHIVAEPAAP